MKLTGDHTIEAKKYRNLKIQGKECMMSALFNSYAQHGCANHALRGYRSMLSSKPEQPANKPAWRLDNTIEDDYTDSSGNM